MAEKREIKFYAINNITQATIKDSLYAVKGSGENTFKLYVTDLDGNLVPLFTSSGGSGGGITNITSTDSSILVTGSAVRDLKVSTALQTIINSALQSGDPISSLINDSGFLTIADIPVFNPLDYDLEDFNNSGADPFVKQSEVVETDPFFLASEAALFVSGDKANLDANTGDETTISIQTKRPLKTINGNSLEGIGDIPIVSITNTSELVNDGADSTSVYVELDELGLVATTNDYGDLDNIPSTFTPSSHTHVEADITNLDKYTQLEVDGFLADKVDKVLGKQLSTEDYTTTEKSKLSGIESGAEVNNISDANATDLTDGGATTLHHHDSRYYTETEVDAMLVKTLVLAASTTPTASLTAVNTNLSSPIASNETLKYTVDLKVTTATGGIKLQVTVPAGAVVHGGTFSANTNSGSIRILNLVENTLTIAMQTTAADSPIQMTFTVKNSTTAGNVIISYASGTGGLTSIVEGSSMQIFKTTLV